MPPWRSFPSQAGTHKAAPTRNSLPLNVLVQAPERTPLARFLHFRTQGRAGIYRHLHFCLRGTSDPSLKSFYCCCCLPQPSDGTGTGSPSIPVSRDESREARRRSSHSRAQRRTRTCLHVDSCVPRTHRDPPRDGLSLPAPRDPQEPASTSIHVAREAQGPAATSLTGSLDAAGAAKHRLSLPALRVWGPASPTLPVFSEEQVCSFPNTPGTAFL